MKSELAKHFEDVEEKLRRLEDIALSPASCHEAEMVWEPGEGKFDGMCAPADGGGPEKLREKSESLQAIPLSDEANSRTELAFRREANHGWKGMAGTALPSLSHAFESQALQECRIQTRYLIQGAIEEARHRLKSLAEAMIPQFQSGIEKALEKSASAAINRAAVSFEQQIRDVIGRGMNEAFSRGMSGILKAASVEKTLVDGKAVGGERSQEATAQTLAPAVEEIPSQSAAFLDEVRRQMQDTLRSFEENAAKRVSEEFQKTAGDLLEREIRQIRTSLGKAETPDAELPLTHENSPGDAEKSQTTVASPETAFPANGKRLGPALLTAERGRWGKRSLEKSRRNQPTWRILGL